MQAALPQGWPPHALAAAAAACMFHPARVPDTLLAFLVPRLLALTLAVPQVGSPVHAHVSPHGCALQLFLGCPAAEHGCAICALHCCCLQSQQLAACPALFPGLLLDSISPTRAAGGVPVRCSGAGRGAIITSCCRLPRLPRRCSPAPVQVSSLNGAAPAFLAFERANPSRLSNRSWAAFRIDVHVLCRLMELSQKLASVRMSIQSQPPGSLPR